MRVIGQLENEIKARAFGDYLYAQGIENQIEREKDGSYMVWILPEEQLDQAKAMLEGFRVNPADAKYRSAATVAEEMREQKKQEQLEYERRVKQRRHLFRPLRGYGFGPVTFLLICVSVLVFLGQQMEGSKIEQLLRISNYNIQNTFDSSLWQEFRERVSHISESLPEVRSGEVWRLFTPMFMHFGVFHIFFNMLWLRDLGSMVEGRQNSLWLTLLVLVLAAASNLVQYFVSGPGFGGMSGVVYGLFGYIWIRGKLDPASGLFVHPQTVTMMILWYFLCLFGVISNVANTAHGVGLLVGMAWGALSSLRHR